MHILNYCHSMLQSVTHSGAPSYPRDCYEAKLRGYTVSGPYAVQPDTSLPPITVCCDMDTDGGGWTVFHRRMDTTNFDYNWQVYRLGFGTVCGSFWSGLDNIHQLTKWKIAPHELRVDLWDWEGNTAHAKYQSFWIGDASTEFRLYIDGYSGTAGDSLSDSAGYRFTTTDNDNDRHSGNCASIYYGAGWHTGCGYFGLNGPYQTSSAAPGNYQGVIWYRWKRSWSYSLKKAEMKIRPNPGTCPASC